MVRLWRALLVVQLSVTGLITELPPTFNSSWQFLRYECLPIWQGTTPKYLAKSAQMAESLQRQLQELPEPVICENMGHALLGNKQLWYCDPINYTVFSQQGRFDESAFLERMKSGQVPVVVIQRLEQNPRFTPLFMETLLRHYQELPSDSGEHIFLFKASALAR